MFLRIFHKIALASAALLLAGCIVDTRQATQLPVIPEALAVAAEATLTQIVPAEGVQIYACKPNKEDSSKLEWTFIAPEATLFDEAGQVIGKHYGGPTWEGDDGSKVIGEVQARADAPTADAIPWLLLKIKTSEGSGIFGNLSAIHRLETTGGKAPTNGCDQAHLDIEVRVPYTAVYYFYTTQG